MLTPKTTAEVTVDEPKIKIEEVLEANKTQERFDVPLSAELQSFIVVVANYYEIDPALIIAIIEQESNYQSDVIGDGGESYGLMQIQPRWHLARMESLGVTDLLDPYENIEVGVNILAEKLRNYETVGEALTAYNAGDVGAYKLYFSKGIYANDYAEKVMERWTRLKEK